MSNIQIGRTGSVGIGIESQAGTGVSASAYVPFTDLSVRGHHEPIEVVSSKASRLMDVDSVVGKKWGEGDLAINLDVFNSGYLWKMALGQETYTAGTPSNHLFYTTVSGNTPTTATLKVTRGDVDVEQYAYAAVDELSMEVSDGLATLSASLLTDFPVNTSAQTVTVTSGTVLSFKDMTVKFGTTIATAESATATPVNDFSLSIANNLETIHRSGSATVSAIKTKGLRISGSYTLFFDSETDKNAYYALSKRAMEINFTGNANEAIRIRIPRFRLSEGEVTTGVDDFYAINAEFVAEDYIDTGSGTRLIDVLLQNSKTSVY